MMTTEGKNQGYFWAFLHIGDPPARACKTRKGKTKKTTGDGEGGGGAECKAVERPEGQNSKRREKKTTTGGRMEKEV